MNWKQCRIGWIVAAMAVLAVGCSTDPVENGSTPTLDVTDSISMSAQVGESAQETLRIGNTGEAVLEVDLEIVEGMDWLELDTMSGDIEIDDELSIGLSAICPDTEEAASYDAVIRGTSNDPFQEQFDVSVELSCLGLEEARLVVDVEGLPAELDADMTVTGPSEFSADLTGPETLEGLAPGEYTVEVMTVEEGIRQFEALQTPLEVTLEAGEQVESTASYELVSGALEVDVVGLAEGLDHDINLVGEGEAWPVPQDGEMADLSPGEYTLVPEVVEGDVEVYQASEVDVTIASAQTTQATVEYLLGAGALVVDVMGLDNDVDHAIELVDSHGEITDVPQSGELSALAPGSYTLEVHDAHQGLRTYRAQEGSASIDVTIESDQSTEVDVVYELVFAEWEVAIEGLPDQADADVDVIGGDLDTTIVESTSWNNLVPDTYDIEANNVSGLQGLGVYEASSSSVDVASGANEPAVVTYEVVTGTLNVIVSGLNGLDADIDVQDSEGDVVAELTGSQVLSDLAPGSYTVVPNPVQDGATTFTAATQTNDVLSNATTDVQIQYLDVPGELELDASGLPQGAELSAHVTGPGNFSSNFTGAQTVGGLEPGSYTVTFQAVDTDQWTTYQPDPVELTVDVTSDVTPEATTSYARVDGQLQLTAADVPSGFELDAMVEGPQGYSQAVSGEQTLSDLVPGSYTVTFSDIDTDQWTTYEANPGQVTVDVESGATPVAETNFELITTALSVSATGLPGNLELQAQLEGPQSYSETINGAQSISDLVPGEYTISFEAVDDGGLTSYEPDPEEVVVDANSGDPVNVSTHYERVDGALDISANGVPESSALEATITGPNNYSNSISGEQIVEGLSAGEYTINFHDIDVGQYATYEADPAQVVMAVESGDPTPVSTTYDVVRGGIDLDAQGLGSQLSLEATISGPEGYSEEFSGAQTVGDLYPGEYTVTFSSIEDGSITYTANPVQVEIGLESGDLAEAHTTYETVEGGLEVSVDFPAPIQEFTLQIVDDQGTPVAQSQVSNGSVEVFDDLEATEHTVVAEDGVFDEWGNEYSELEGFGESHQVESGNIIELTVSGIQPTLVRSESDDGPASLRQVVGTVNAESVITFEESVETIALSDQIEIETGLTIMGRTYRQPVIEATGEHRIFEVASDAAEVAEPVLQLVTLRGGDSAGRGGAIYTFAPLTLFDVTLEDNRSQDNGGAIASTARLDLYGVDFINNSTDFGDGGALYVGQVMVGEELEFRQNRAGDEGTNYWGGAIYIGSAGGIEIEDAVFAQNEATGHGGAIMGVFGSGLIDVERSLFYENSSGHGGGAIRTGGANTTTISNSTFYRNQAAEYGGAIRHQHEGSTTLYHVTMVDNEAPLGPAIQWSQHEDASFSIGQSLIADNGTEQSEFDIDPPSDAELEPIGSDFDNVVTSVNEDYFDASDSWDQVGTVEESLDAHLHRFGYNGGAPKTFSVTEDSPAHELVISFDCAEVDQRGFSRPPSSSCTAGAWERDPNLEDFENLNLANSYQSGDFEGHQGIEWYYEDAKNAASSSQDVEIDGNGLILRGDSGRFGAANIPGGVTALSLQYRMAYSPTPVRQFEVLINGDVVASSPEFGSTDDDEGVVYTLEIEDLGIEGDFDLEVQHLSSGTSAQVTFDNIRWQ